MRKYLFITGVILLAIGVIAGLSNQAGAAEKVYTLKITQHHGPTHHLSRAMKEAFFPLEKMSGGRIKIRHFTAGSLAKGREAADAVLGGVADIGWLSYGYWPGRFPLAYVCEIPGMFPSASVATDAMNKMMLTTPFFKKEFADFKMLNFTTTSPRIYFIKDKITKFSELKGKRIRTAGGIETKSIEATGSVPVLMGSGEIYTSMERGLLFGMVFPIASCAPYRFYEVADYAVENMILGVTSMGVVMNKKSWESLPPDLQAMVAEAGINHERFSAQYYDSDSNLAIAFMKKKGMKFYNLPDAELAKFHNSLKPVKTNWIADMKKQGLPGQECLEALEGITKKLTQRWK